MRRVGEQLLHLLEDAERELHRSGEKVAHGVGSLGVVGPEIFGGSRDFVRCERLRLESIALKIEKLERQFHAALAVGDGVVELLDQRRSVALDPFDNGELPQRASPVERVSTQQRRKIEELAFGAGLGKRDTAEVQVDVEIRVLDPFRCAHVARCGLHSLAQTRHAVAGTDQAFAEQVEVRLAVEDRDRGERRREMRVFL